MSILAPINFSNVYAAWVALLNQTVFSGYECAPRGKKIVEVLHTQVTVADARNNILACPERDLNFRFMVAEWLWIQSGRLDVAWIERFNKNITQFSDDGLTFRGAYGPRFRGQVNTVLDLLHRDPDSRQAIIRIFDGLDLIGTTKDVPCTLSLQLLLRQGKLHGVMTMRSNDLWLGFPYDFFNFSQITNSLAGELAVPVGSFTLQAGSSHIYEKDYEKVNKVLKAYREADRPQVLFERSPQLERLAPPDICRLLPVNRELGVDHLFTQTMTESEKVYVQALACGTKAQALEMLRTL